MASDQQDQSNNIVSPVQQRRLIERLKTDRTFLVLLTLCVVGLVFMLASFLVPLFKDAPASLLTQIVQQIGLALFVTSVVSIAVTNLVENTRSQLEHRLDTFLQEVITKRLDDIQQDTKSQIKEQTNSLIETSTSLQAMGNFHVSQLYVKREDAIENIKQDLSAKKISGIRLIGISLNDFVRDNGVFHDIWKLIVDYSTGDLEPPTPKDCKLDIRILIVDPNCFGALLRSRGELRNSAAPLQSRLAKDIDYTKDAFDEIEKNIMKMGGNARVSFSFHLYQLPPMLFLFWTDVASYVQPYYFWSSRDPAKPMPLLRYSDQSSLHKGMTDHFNWIWQKASISSSDYYNQYLRGVDKGLHQSGVINVFDDPEEAKKRILSLMETTQNRLYIQGFSLRSYFDGEGELYRTIKQIAEQKNVDIRVLLIDPNSEQAKYRSFREYLLENPDASITFEQFGKDPYKRRQLYHETERSVQWLRRIKNTNDKFHFKWHNTAPYCFMLMVDDTVLVEQYHYGKVGPLTGSTPLGKDMVRFEYAREISDPYQEDKRLRPYELLESHFNFVFQQCAQDVPSSFAQEFSSVAEV